MMAQRWRAIPLCGKGEPFTGFEKVGEGLSSPVAGRRLDK